MAKIATFLWFDDRAEEAASLYVSMFPGSRIVRISRYPEGAPRPAGSVMTVDFELEGRPFIALNGGPYVQFNDAISLAVSCETQDEVDALWDRFLGEGGTAVQCGWLKDRFGLSWQIVPAPLFEMLHDPDPDKARRVNAAMLAMVKLDLPALRRAYDGV